MSTTANPAPRTTPPPIDCPACGQDTAPYYSRLLNGQQGGKFWKLKLRCRCCGWCWEGSLPAPEHARPVANITTR